MRRGRRTCSKVMRGGVQSQSATGFSLVELLVVIGIIGILIGLLLPTLTRVREAANTVKCAAQLRQIGQGIIAYTATHDGMLPPWSGHHAYPNDIAPDDKFGPGWILLIEPNLGAKPDSPLFKCPSYRSDEFAVTYFLEARYTGRQTVGGPSMPISKIRLASQFVLSGDVTNTYWYPSPIGSWDRGFDNIDKDDYVQECILFFGETHADTAVEGGGFNMHRAGNNVLFADGHVAAFRKFDPQAITYHPTQRKNWSDITAVD